MINANRFKEEIKSLLDTLYESQKDNMEAVAQTMKECIANGGVVHVFGSGHSVGLGIDIKCCIWFIGIHINPLITVI